MLVAGKIGTTIRTCVRIGILEPKRRTAVNTDQHVGILAQRFGAVVRCYLVVADC